MPAWPDRLQEPLESYGAPLTIPGNLPSHCEIFVYWARPTFQAYTAAVSGPDFRDVMSLSRYNELIKREVINGDQDAPCAM